MQRITDLSARCKRSPVYATGKAAEPTPSPLILFPFGLSCPQSLCLSAFHFSKYEEARKCFLYSKICVRLLGYVVLQCDVESNKASAHRKGEKETALLILFNPW